MMEKGRLERLLGDRPVVATDNGGCCSSPAKIRKHGASEVRASEGKRGHARASEGGQKRGGGGGQVRSCEGMEVK